MAPPRWRRRGSSDVADRTSAAYRRQQRHRLSEGASRERKRQAPLAAAAEAVAAVADTAAPGCEASADRCIVEGGDPSADRGESVPPADGGPSRSGSCPRGGV